MTDISLADLGWSAHFAAQLDIDETARPARISEVTRDHIIALTPDGPVPLYVPEQTGAYAVGDWVLHDGTSVLRRLDRTTALTRRAAGPRAGAQLIAANVDTLGIVTSCNADFNPARIERYLAMAAATGCMPLVILTKPDLSDNPEDYVRQAERLSPIVTAIALNGTDAEDTARLASWCSKGQTLAFLGSSGVGKTTLQNHLTGIAAMTQDIREDDAKGRHTTTARSLRPTLHGGWLIDTPGMREFGLTDAADGIEAVFSDVTDLLGQCRFTDCAHETEPGCAVRAAIDDGTLDEDRLDRWRKLIREDQHTTETIAQSRARFRKLGKMHKTGKLRGQYKRGEE